MKAEVMAFVVQTWDPTIGNWSRRYTFTPRYRFSKREKTVGHLWWKQRYWETVSVSPEKSRRRAFKKALRRAKALPDDYVRILMEVLYSDGRDISRTQVWSNNN